MKVLIVEDDPLQLGLLENMLLREYAVVTAENADVALELIQQQEEESPIAVVVTDQNMPRMQGNELLKKLSQISEDTLGILMTGEEMDVSTLTSALNEGHIYAYLNKPCRKAALLEVVSKAMELFSVRVLNKRLAHELLNANQVLEQQVRERTRELEAQTLLLQKQNEKLRQFQEDIDVQMTQAQATQCALLPAAALESAHLKARAHYIPLRKIGGDFYDVLQLRNKRYGLLVVDVSGHDLAAALVSFMISGIFRSYSDKSSDVLETVYGVNEQLAKSLEKGRFASMFYGIYNANSSIFTYCSAGHPGALLLHKKTKIVQHLRTKGGVIGVVPASLMKFQKSEVAVELGDRLFLYTDAILELESKESQSNLYETRLKDLEQRVLQTSEKPLDDALEFITSETLKQAGQSSFQDDFTLLAVEIHSEQL